VYLTKVQKPLEEDNKMLLLDRSYVSPLLADTIREDTIACCSMTDPNYQIDPQSMDASIRSGNRVGDKILANTEGSLKFLQKNMPNSQITRWVEIFKDKIKFREYLADPEFFYLAVDNLEEVDLQIVKFPCILKPSVGYASIGVYQIANQAEFKSVVEKISKDTTCKFSEDIVNTTRWIIEQYIEGEEYAIDAYFNSEDKPTILNIFHHPFIDGDLSDKVYYTGRSIIEKTYHLVMEFLSLLGEKMNLTNFPMHLEVRIANEKLYPIEVNPLRFAGMGGGDLAQYAYGINIYRCFFSEISPDWTQILANLPQDRIFGFYCAQTSNERRTIDPEWLSNFDTVLDYRSFADLGLSMLCLVFFQSTLADIHRYLVLDVEPSLI